MLDLFLCLVAAGLVCGLSTSAIAAGGDDPGEYSVRTVLVLDKPRLAALRELVRNDPDAAARLAELKAEVDALPADRAPGLEVIHYEGLVNTDPKRIETVRSLRRVEESALRFDYWQATGDEAAAARLREAIRAWAKTYRPTGNDVNEYKLFALFAAYLALRETFPEADRKPIDAWIEEFGRLHFDAVRTSDQFTNRYTKHVHLLGVFAAILDRPEWTREAEDGLRRFVQNGLRADGSSLDFEIRDTLTYHASALRPLLQWLIARNEEAAYRATAPGGGSIERSVLFVVPYASGERSREEWKNTSVDLDRRRAAAGLAEYQPGRTYEPRRARNLLEEAAYFDAELAPLARSLHDRPQDRYPVWRSVVLEACRVGARAGGNPATE